MKIYRLGAPLLFVLPVCTQAAEADDYAPIKPEAVSTLSTVTVRGTRQGSLNEGYTAAGTSAATGMPLSLREVPQSVSVLTDKQMKDQGRRNVYDALRWVNGISGNVTGSSYATTTLYARGEAVNDYQIDGIPTDTNGDQLLNSGAYERVEVVRGTSALTGGVGDPSASVNLVRKRPTKERQAEIAAGFGRWRRWNAEADVSGPLNPSGSLRGRAVVNAEGGRHWTEGSRSRSGMVYGIAEYDFSPQTTAYAGINHQRWREKDFYDGQLPVFDSAGYPTHFGLRDNNQVKGGRYTGYSTELFAGLEHRFDNDWKAKLEYRYSRGKTDNPGQGSVAVTRLNRDSGEADVNFYGMTENITGHGFSFKLNGQYGLWGRQHEAVFGINGYRSRDSRYWQNPEGDYAVDNVYDFLRRRDYPAIASVDDWVRQGDRLMTDQISGYAATRLHATDKLSLLLGTNYAHYRYRNIYTLGEGENTEAKEGRFAPYAGITYDLTDSLSAYASYSRLFMPQDTLDSGRRPLGAITGHTVETGLKGEWLGGRLNASLSVFQSKRRNVAVEAGRFDNDETYYRGANIKAHGWEAEIGGSPAEGWDISAGVQSHLNREENGNQPNSQYDPRHSFKLFTTYRLPKTRWTLGGGVRWQSKTFVDKYSDLSAGIEFDDDEAKERARALSRQKAFAVVDLTAQYEVSKNAELTLNFDNVFDKRYRLDTVYHAYGTPRSLTGTFRYRF